MLNHRDSINPNYMVKLYSLQAEGTFPMVKEHVSKSIVIDMLKPIKEDKNYTKHYFPENDKLKVFLKGGSSLEVDMQSGKAFYESLKKRPIISQFNRLHYNPKMVDFILIFAVSLIIITITGYSSSNKEGILGRAASNWRGSLCRFVYAVVVIAEMVGSSNIDYMFLSSLLLCATMYGKGCRC